MLIYIVYVIKNCWCCAALIHIDPLLDYKTGINQICINTALMKSVGSQWNSLAIQLSLKRPYEHLHLACVLAFYLSEMPWVSVNHKVIDENHFYLYVNVLLFINTNVIKCSNSQWLEIHNESLFFVNKYHKKLYAMCYLFYTKSITHEICSRITEHVTLPLKCWNLVNAIMCWK